MHVASHRRRLVLVLTDTMGSQTLAQALLGGDSSAVQIATDELCLYRQFDRYALVRNPVQRLAKAHQHYTDLGVGPVECFDEFVIRMCQMLGASTKIDADDDEVNALWFSYVLPQFVYMGRGRDCEVDGLLDLSKANVWLPYLQRRYGLDDIGLDDSIGQNSGPLPASTLSLVQKTYSQDYAILKELKGAPFVAL